MDPKKFIEPKEIEIDESKYVISKIPAVQAQQVYRSIMKEAKDDGDKDENEIKDNLAILRLQFSPPSM